MWCRPLFAGMSYDSHWRTSPTRMCLHAQVNAPAGVSMCVLCAGGCRRVVQQVARSSYAGVRWLCAWCLKAQHPQPVCVGSCCCAAGQGMQPVAGLGANTRSFHNMALPSSAPDQPRWGCTAVGVCVLPTVTSTGALGQVPGPKTVAHACRRMHGHNVTLLPHLSLQPVGGHRMWAVACAMYRTCDVKVAVCMSFPPTALVCVSAHPALWRAAWYACQGACISFIA